MSHHINFDIPATEKDTDLVKSVKTPKTDSARKRETKKLEIDNKQMEWRLHQLKLVMEKEKEERSKKSYIWKSGKDGALDSYARNVLGRSVKSTAKSKQSGEPKKSKLKVLTDEPLDIPKRTSHSKDLINKLIKPTPPKTKSPTADVHFMKNINKECWISIAFDKSSEDVMEIQSDQHGNLPLESLLKINPSAIGLYFMRYGRKRLLLAVENRVVQPKAGWGTETYHPYVANISPQRMKVEPTPPNSSRSFVAKIRKPKLTPENPSNEGSLLQGSVNEEENSRLFQQAIMEWRRGKMEAPSTPQAPVEMAVHDVQSDPVKIDITFSETSTLSFMEKLLVKKHRETSVPPLPYDVKNDNEGLSQREEVLLTADELEEQERYRMLFTPQPSFHSSDCASTLTADEQVCRISEVDDTSFDVMHNNWCDVQQSNATCYVVEASDEDNESVASSENPTNEQYATGPFASVMPKVRTTNSLQDCIENGNMLPHFKITEVQEDWQMPQQKGSDYVKHSQMSIHHQTPFKASYTVDNPASKSSSPLLDTSEALKQSKKFGKASAVVSAISNIPLNPDALYNRDLEEYNTEKLSEWNKLDEVLNQSPADVMLCNNGATLWTLESSVAKVADVENGPATNEQRDGVMNEELEQERDDAEELHRLEWELASQTGNITDDGRISRLIDEWSSSDDEELGIVNDHGMGSGLSTPDCEPINVVGASLSWQDDEKMQEEFQKMEDLMCSQMHTSSDNTDSD